MEEVSQDNFKVALNQATSVLQFNAWKGTSAQSNDEDEVCGPLAYELRLTSGSNANSEVDASQLQSSSSYVIVHTDKRN